MARLGIASTRAIGTQGPDDHDRHGSGRRRRIPIADRVKSTSGTILKPARDAVKRTTHPYDKVIVAAYRDAHKAYAHFVIFDEDEAFGAFETRVESARRLAGPGPWAVDRG